MFASYQEYRHRLHVEQNHRGPRGSYNNITTDLQETRTTISTDHLEQEGSPPNRWTIHQSYASESLCLVIW